MKIKDSDILIVPGAGNPSPFHWLTRWQDNMSTARRVDQDDWNRPQRETWVNRLVDAVGESEKPVILVMAEVRSPIRHQL